LLKVQFWREVFATTMLYRFSNDTKEGVPFSKHAGFERSVFYWLWKAWNVFRL